jgi:hypothetical protein
MRLRPRGPRVAKDGRNEEALAVMSRRRLQGLGRGERWLHDVVAEHVLRIERMGQRRHIGRVDLLELRHEADDLREFAGEAVELGL